MLFWNRFIWSVGAILLALTLNGCSLSGESQQDDEKEPHFVLGKSRVNARDFAGAASAFKEALEVNPHSAAAHYQLGWIYENPKIELTDPAAAIYHYQEYLKLDPKAGNADVIKQHIDACKRQLIQDVMQLPSAPAAQQLIEKLAEQNKRMQDELDKWHAYYEAEMAAHTNPPAQPPPSHPLPPSQLVGQPAAQPAGQTAGSGTPNNLNAQNPRHALPIPPALPPRQPAQVRPRTHIVAAGETLALIARKSGVSLPALQAANPGLNPRHIRAGQTINLPPP